MNEQTETVDTSDSLIANTPASEPTEQSTETEQTEQPSEYKLGDLVVTSAYYTNLATWT